MCSYIERDKRLRSCNKVYISLLASDKSKNIYLSLISDRKIGKCCKLARTWDEYTEIRNIFVTSITLSTVFSRTEVPALIVGQNLYVVVRVQRLNFKRWSLRYHSIIWLCFQSYKHCLLDAYIVENKK